MTPIPLNKVARPVRRVVWQLNDAPTNIYHCCVHKTASQWVAGILYARSVQLRTGLAPHRYQKYLPEGYDTRPLDRRYFNRPLPERTVVSPLYLDYGSYQTIEKPDRYATFFVGRDPRDLLCSWYFSMRHSHPVNPVVEERRRRLEGVSKREGLIYGIHTLEERGAWRALRSWASADDPDVLLVTYEALTGPGNQADWSKLLRHLGIGRAEASVRKLLEARSFEALTRRARGEQDPSQHLRSGQPGGWVEHFDTETSREFEAVAGDLVESWGYDSTIT